MSRTTEALEFAEFIKSLGFRVWLSRGRPYGFISDDTGKRVLSFSFNGGTSLGGNYGPPSRESGTGWVINRLASELRTAEDVRTALYATPPVFCGKGWEYLTTVEQHLATYGASSRYVELQS